MSPLSKLTALMLSYNDLAAVPPGLDQLARLKVLHIDNNPQIQTLPATLVTMIANNSGVIMADKSAEPAPELAKYRCNNTKGNPPVVFCSGTSTVVRRIGNNVWVNIGTEKLCETYKDDDDYDDFFEGAEWYADDCSFSTTAVSFTVPVNGGNVGGDSDGGGGGNSGDDDGGDDDGDDGNVASGSCAAKCGPCAAKCGPMCQTEEDVQEKAVCAECLECCTTECPECC